MVGLNLDLVNSVRVRLYASSAGLTNT
eukprot:SAG31_NODE_30484_length_380_cov_1.252669_1_plen_26_part_10